jgi:hypothetical protein
MKLIGSLADGREIVRRSCDVRTFTPVHPQEWDEPYQKFLKFI